MCSKCLASLRASTHSRPRSRLSGGRSATKMSCLDTGSQRDQSVPFEEQNEAATQALDAVRGCHCALMDFARARGLLSSDEDAKAREVLPTVGMPLEPRETAETCGQP